jgi:hypothetical protein
LRVAVTGAEDALGNEVEDMREASRLVCGPGEVFNERGEMFDHLVIIGGIVSGDTKYLSEALKVYIISIITTLHVPYH